MRKKKVEKTERSKGGGRNKGRREEKRVEDGSLGLSLYHSLYGLGYFI